MHRLATVLGAVATLVTLACGALVAAAGDDGVPVRSVVASPVWQVVTAPGGIFEVPPEADGWTVREPDRVVYYVDEGGEPLVGVAGPAVLDDGYCRESSDPSNRGFAGLTGPHPGAVREVNRREARRWRTAVAGRPTTDGRTVRLLLADGSVAVRTTALVHPPAPGPCQPERVALDHVSVAGPDGVVTLVVVRDLGSGAVWDAVVERILRSLRVR